MARSAAADWPSEYATIKVATSKLNLEVLKGWVTTRLNELGADDEILVPMVANLLDEFEIVSALTTSCHSRKGLLIFISW